MSIISYIDDNSQLAECYLKRSYHILDSEIEHLTHKPEVESFQIGDQVYGYEITKNMPLTNLYGFPCYVVKFIFKNVESLHNPDNLQYFEKLYYSLKEKIYGQRGYYNLRIPVHIIDLLQKFNEQMQNYIFCGGTVECVYVGGFQPHIEQADQEFFFADRAFADRHRDEMIQIAFDSFDKFHGQYHISPVMQSKAGAIYRNWIQSFFDDFKENTVLTAVVSGEIAGFALIKESGTSVDVVLNAINHQYRGKSAYKNLINAAIQYARSRGKIFVSSTQIDNFIVQGAWASLGMRPFYAIYNMHCSNL